MLKRKPYSDCLTSFLRLFHPFFFEDFGCVINVSVLESFFRFNHNPAYSEDTHIVVASSISTASNSKTEIHITNTSPNLFTLRKTHLSRIFAFCPLRRLNNCAHSTLQHSKYWHRKIQNKRPRQNSEYVNELLKSIEKPKTVQNIWFPTRQPG